MTAISPAQTALFSTLSLLSFSGCAAVDVMAERQREVGLKVVSSVGPGSFYSEKVTSIFVTPLRPDRHYLLQVSSGYPDGIAVRSSHLGSWAFDVSSESVGIPIELDVNKLTRVVVQGVESNEINAKRGCNALWVCEMSKDINPLDPGHRIIFNTTWFYLEPGKK